MSAPLYSRYVPPRPSKPAHTEERVPLAETQDNGNNYDQQLKQDVKNSKKRKRSGPSADTTPTTNNDVGQVADAGSLQEPAETTDDDEPSTLKKPKKVKKAKKSKAQEEAQEDEAEERARLGKHNAVMGKFQKASKLADAKRSDPDYQTESTKPADDAGMVAQGLEPIPQPAQDLTLDLKPVFSALPPWLAKPVIVKSDFTQAFKELNISTKVLENLKKQNLVQSFAVQAALLPLLLPGPDAYNGDLLVSAATGSGKTLAYVLPLIENLKKKLATKLRAIIVVPTRDLVVQVKETAEMFASGTGIQIGTAVGSFSLPLEQELLVAKSQVYNPKAARGMYAQARNMLLGKVWMEERTLQDVRETLPDHVPSFNSRVDLLICTPGRLVEHIQSTRGFSLEDLDWLIIDEADRLLDEDFSDWVAALMTGIEQRKPSLRQVALGRMWMKPEPERVRKVVLSATMTRDLNKLASLKLYRPTLVAISDQAGNIIESTQISGETTEIVDLPQSLSEFAVPVGDGAEKPLYLLQLLQTRVFPGFIAGSSQKLHSTKRRPAGEVNESDNSDSSDSSDSSDTTDSDSESDSDGSSTTDSSTASSRSSSQIKTQSNGGFATTERDLSGSTPATANALIFTSNNENATRLARLLQTLNPSTADLIGTITKTSASAESRKLLRQFRNGRIKVLIASDRASRGLDVPALSSVINYDMPRSLSDYVHRVGRTARAGQRGTAWTLFTETEARWFWNEIARATSVQRGARCVWRAKLDPREFEPTWKANYKAALKDLQGAVKAS